eukprot:1141499-Pelagomonas_calceolata.AAC.1
MQQAWTSQRTSIANRIAKRARQSRQLSAKQRHVHLIKIKYCEDTRPGQQLEAGQRQHAVLCKLICAKLALHHDPILLGVGGTCYTERTLNQYKQLGLDHQRANKLARKLHGHSVKMQTSLVPLGVLMKNTYFSQPGSGAGIPGMLTRTWLLLGHQTKVSLEQKGLVVIGRASGSTQIQNLGFHAWWWRAWEHTLQNGHAVYKHA